MMPPVGVKLAETPANRGDPADSPENTSRSDAQPVRPAVRAAGRTAAAAQRRLPLRPIRSANGRNNVCAAGRRPHLYPGGADEAKALRSHAGRRNRRAALSLLFGRALPAIPEALGKRLRAWTGL